jgi:hypothetical protein
MLEIPVTRFQSYIFVNSKAISRRMEIISSVALSVSRCCTNNFVFKTKSTNPIEMPGGAVSAIY